MLETETCSCKSETTLVLTSQVGSDSAEPNLKLHRLAHTISLPLFGVGEPTLPKRVLGKLTERSPTYCISPGFEQPASINCIALKETKWCFLQGVHPTLFPYYLVLILRTHCTLVKICNHWKVWRHCGGSVDVGKSRNLIGPYSGTHPRCHHCHQQWWIQRDNSGDDDDIGDYDDDDEDDGWWVEVAWTMIILCKRKQCNSPSCTPATYCHPVHAASLKFRFHL